MSAQGGAFVQTEVDDRGVGTITFAHPASNSLPGHLLRKLAESISAAGTSDDIKVVVLRSAGDRAFCAGASFDELVAIQNEQEGLDFFSGFAMVINAIRTCPKFVVGRVQGKAVGGGVGLASAVDICYATSYASVKLSELAVGIGPFVVGPAVERKIGTSAMGMLAIDAKSWKDARWAAQQGMYTEVFDNASDMDNAIDTLTTDLASSNPEAMSELKRVLWEGTEHWDDLLMERAAVSGRLVLSSFTKDAIARFKS
ncbi:MAG TPA: enoyl-CoA hydratase [Flavobacteriales bacterium]|nr:enoyl-CoA hydratase [Crocinitomicaceae bacterium]HCC65043.1 enoyl-CoA hydratase [Flavobacteriales bacterium]|tara:strand:+ start:1327 stop:2094 length:768 start_codon:yes stop_codon:yes gene_type:complete